jgi:hypothetical protein
VNILTIDSLENYVPRDLIILSTAPLLELQEKLLFYGIHPFLLVLWNKLKDLVVFLTCPQCTMERVGLWFQCMVHVRVFREIILLTGYYNLSIATQSNWLLIGDFNLIRSHENINKPGGDVHEMLLFNEIIGHLAF